MKISTRHFNIIIKILLGTAALLFIGAITFWIYLIVGKESVNSAEASVPLLHQSQLADATNAGNIANWQEGDVRYQGVHYRYNEDIITILFLGIDKMEEVKSTESGSDGGHD